MSQAQKSWKPKPTLRWFALVVLDGTRRNVLVVTGTDGRYTLPMYRAAEHEAHGECLARMHREGWIRWSGTVVLQKNDWYFIRGQRLPDGHRETMRAYLARFVKPPVLPEGCRWFPVAEIRSRESERLFDPLAYDILEHVLVKQGH